MKPTFWTGSLILLFSTSEILIHLSIADSSANVAQLPSTFTKFYPENSQSSSNNNYIHNLANPGQIGNAQYKPTLFTNSESVSLSGSVVMPAEAPPMPMIGTIGVNSEQPSIINANSPTFSGSTVPFNNIPGSIQPIASSELNGFPYVYGVPGLQNLGYANTQNFYGIPCKVENQFGNCINPSNDHAIQLCKMMGNQLSQGDCLSGSSCCYSLISNQPRLNPETNSNPIITNACTVSPLNKGFCIEDTTKGHNYCSSLKFSAASISCFSGFFCCYEQSSGQDSYGISIEIPQNSNVCGVKRSKTTASGRVFTKHPSDNLASYNIPPFTPATSSYASYSTADNPSLVNKLQSFNSPLINNVILTNGSPTQSSNLIPNIPVTQSPNLNTSQLPHSDSVNRISQHHQSKRDVFTATSNNILNNDITHISQTIPNSTLSEDCWQAAIYVKGKFKCSGSLIQRQWVLTSAYCVFGQDPFNIRVRLAAFDLKGDISGSQIKAVEDVYVNENYDPDSVGYENNVALVHLKLPATLDSACFICLPGIPSDLLVDQQCTVTGYGSNALGQNRESYLRLVEQTIVSDHYCTSTVSKVVKSFVFDKSYLCTAGASGADSCLADGGSPLICQDEKGIYHQYGIASWSIGCGVNNIPTIYTDVYTFVDWINRIIESVEKKTIKSNQKGKK